MGTHIPASCSRAPNAGGEHANGSKDELAGGEGESRERKVEDNQRLGAAAAAAVAAVGGEGPIWPDSVCTERRSV